MAFKIDKNIPIKPAKFSDINFPFKDMEVGDSFLVPHDFCNRQTIHNKLDSFNRHSSVYIKISLRKEKEGIRVWRIK